MNFAKFKNSIQNYTKNKTATAHCLIFTLNETFLEFLTKSPLLKIILECQVT